MKEILLNSRDRHQMIDVTGQVCEILLEDGLQEGAVVLQSLHTTSALTINESADPDVSKDILAKLENLVPHREVFYQHSEGNSDSHLKASTFGSSLTVLVHEGSLVLGTWQGIFFCEFDGPRNGRRIAVQILRAG
jgi:secondary thiamine-phosphate synthase enzyme